MRAALALLLLGSLAYANVGPRDSGGYIGTDSLPSAAGPTVVLPAFYLAAPSPSPTPGPGVDNATLMMGGEDAVFSLDAAITATGGAIDVYGDTLGTCFVHTNGVITCGLGAPTPEFTNTPMPTGAWDSRVFAPFWDDLKPVAGLSSITTGFVSGNYFFVQWNDFARFADPSARLTFRVTFQLLTDPGFVLFQYLKMTGAGADGSSATIGIQDGSTGTFNAYSFNTPGAVLTGNGGATALQAILFDYDGDGDRLAKNLESRFGTDDGNHDSDGGGQDDGVEVANNKNPASAGDDNSLGTTDTDADSLTAAEEAFYGTSNTVKDSDGDGINDDTEIYGAHTDPSKADTDRDSFSDKDEATAVTNPLNPFDHPPFPGASLSSGGEARYNPRVAVDGNGNIHVVAGFRDSRDPAFHYWMLSKTGQILIAETVVGFKGVSGIYPHQTVVAAFGGKLYVVTQDRNRAQLLFARLNPANAAQNGSAASPSALLETARAIPLSTFANLVEIAANSAGIHLVYRRESRRGSEGAGKLGFTYLRLDTDGNQVANVPILTALHPATHSGRGIHYKGSRIAIALGADGTAHILTGFQHGRDSARIADLYYSSIKNDKLTGPYLVPGKVEGGIGLTVAGNYVYFSTSSGGGRRSNSAEGTLGLGIFDPSATTTLPVSDDYGGLGMLQASTMARPPTAVYLHKNRLTASWLGVLASGAVLMSFEDHNDNRLCVGAFAPNGTALGSPFCSSLSTHGKPNRNVPLFPLGPNLFGAVTNDSNNTSSVQLGSFLLSGFDLATVVSPPAPVPNTPPTITSAPPSSVVSIGQQLLYTATATDAETPKALTWAVRLGPDGLRISADLGVIAWTPATDGLGAQPVTIQVCDSGLACSFQSFTLIVQVPGTLAITSPPITTAVAGQPYVYQAQATDSGSSITGWSMPSPTPAPGDLAISSSGVVTWSPTASDVGTRPVTIQVTDSSSHSARQQFTIAVSAAAAAGQPTFTSVPSTTAVVGLPWIYQATAIDPSDTSATFTYALTSTASGNLLVAGSGQVLWTPSASEHGTVAISIRADGSNGRSASQSFSVTVLSKDVESAPGCSCDVGGSGGSGLGLALLLLAGLLVRARRRT